MKQTAHTLLSQQQSLLVSCQNKLQISFSKPELLLQALCHSSYVNELNLAIPSNERLEFLGDAILDLIIAEHLFAIFPDQSEGGLSHMKSHLVCEQTLHTLAKDLGLGDFILLSNGEERGGGRLKSAILADAVEAIFGAIYLDQGLFPAKKFILDCYKPHLLEVVSQPISRDAKSKLNELRQKEGKSPPRYETIKEWGNDHAKEYEVGIFFDSTQIASGVGTSKKEASRQAALNAYQLLYQKETQVHG